MEAFSALAAAAQKMDDLDCYVVIIAECQDGSGRRLEIQKAFEYSEEDRKTGTDTYCISDETGATHYGGIVSWRIVGKTLEIQLDDSAAQEMSVVDGYAVLLDVSTDTVESIAKGMEEVLREP